MSTKRPRTLSPSFVGDVTEPGRYGDGRGGLGLSLLVRPAKTEGAPRRDARLSAAGGLGIANSTTTRPVSNEGTYMGLARNCETPCHRCAAKGLDTVRALI